MRIAMLSTFYPYRGGIAQFNARLYKELSEEHELKAFTFKRQYPSLLFPGKTQYVTDLDSAEVVDAERLLDSVNPWSYYKTMRAIRRFNPDVLFLRFWHPFFAPSLGFVAHFLKKRVKIVSLLDNVVPHEDKFFYHPFIRYFLNQSHGFVVMSDIVKNDLQRFIPDAQFLQKQHPLYNHFGEKQSKTEVLERYRLSADKKTILFFGFIREYKGLDILIDAFDLLDDSYQLIIAGESYADFDKYQKQIDGNINKSRILVLNRYIPDCEVAGLFSCADVCVQPYRSATQSGITAISYHFDVPMIVTNVGGLKEDVRDGKTGIIVDEVNSEAVANVVKSYFKNACQSKFQDGIKALKEELSWEVFSKEFIRFCKEICRE